MRIAIPQLFALALIASSAPAADKFPVVVYPAPKAEAPPSIDGVASDPCWASAPLVSGFTLHGQPYEAVDVQTAFRVTYDEETLYFLIVADEPQAAQLTQPSVVRRDSQDVFKHECVELFLDPGHDHVLYYQIAVNLVGAVFDGKRKDTRWNGQVRGAAKVGNGRWTMEVALRLADIGVAKPQPGTMLGFNVCRDRLVNEKQWSSWAPIEGGFHNAPLFGHLLLSPTAEQLDALTAEVRKGERSGELRIFTVNGFAGSDYLTMARGALARVRAAMADMEKIAAASRPGAAQQFRQMIGEAAEATDPISVQLEAAQTLTADEWARLDRQLNEVNGRLNAQVWSVRLKALLEEI